ncbi:MAG: helix-turn-helix domain-containing protein [Blastocatellia bacterium]
MATRFTVKDIAMVKGFRNARELADAAGIGYASMYPIWKGQAKQIKMTTIDRLCRILGVQPGMLMVYEPDHNDRVEDDAGTPPRHH